jgi:hypothetical protein
MAEKRRLTIELAVLIGGLAAATWNSCEARRSANSSEKAISDAHASTDAQRRFDAVNTIFERDPECASKKMWCSFDDPACSGDAAECAPQHQLRLRNEAARLLLSLGPVVKDGLDWSLEHARLPWLDARRLDLSSRSLYGVDLRCADLRGAKLRNTVFRAVDLRGALLDDHSEGAFRCPGICPDGQPFACPDRCFSSPNDDLSDKDCVGTFASACPNAARRVIREGAISICATRIDPLAIKQPIDPVAILAGRQRRSPPSANQVSSTSSQP